MPPLYDSEKLPLTCECGRDTEKPIAWIETHKQFTCPCGAVIDINAEELLRDLGHVEQAHASLERTFKKW